MSKRLLKNDPVIVRTGNDRGVEGKVLAIKGHKILVSGVNKRKKHQKPTEQGKQGTIVEKEMPVHISNVKYCADGKGVKLRARVNDKQEKEIYYRAAEGKDVVVRTIRKAS